MVLLVLVILAGIGIWLSIESFTDAASGTITLSASDFYAYMRPQIVKAVQDGLVTKPAATAAAASGPTLQPNTLPAPVPAAFGPGSPATHTPAMRQGDDYSGCKPFNKDEYIRKDSIPCWGCSIPAPY